MSKYDVIFSAHGSKKMELIDIIEKYRNGLSRLSIAVTGNTAHYIQQMTAAQVGVLKDGISGGYLQIARLVENEDVKIVSFLFDPCSLHMDELGVKVLLKSCRVYNIPLANNKATAEFTLDRFFEVRMSTQYRCPELLVTR